MRVEIDIQRAETLQLIKVVDGKQHEKLEKCLHALFTNAENRDIEQHNKHSIFNVKRRNIETRLATIFYPNAYKFEKDTNWTQKCARLPWPVNPKNFRTGENN